MRLTSGFCQSPMTVKERRENLKGIKMIGLFLVFVAVALILSLNGWPT